MDAVGDEGYHAWIRVRQNAVTQIENVPLGPTRLCQHVGKFTFEDLARLMAAIAESHYRMPILIVLSTGMRRGEVCGLKWSDFDEANSTLAIRRALIQPRGGVMEKGTKTDQDRTLLIPDETTAALAMHKETQGSNPGDWICLNATGGRLAPKSIDKAYRRLRQSVNVSTKLHELRHTWATRQLMAGVPDDVVAKMLGHATTATVHNVYSHPVMKHQQSTLAVTEHMLRQKPSIKVIEG